MAPLAAAGQSPMIIGVDFRTLTEEDPMSKLKAGLDISFVRRPRGPGIDPDG